jgi:hypothetical protein
LVRTAQSQPGGNRSRNRPVADLGVGFAITVNGTRSGADYLASRVGARGRKTAARPAVRPAPSASATHHARDDDQ